ncbi:hypothetical protein WJX73_002099 [Symbiochloris irregularis]|uniref:HAUS augmin-like complex subunit 3 N-terminal domain-containing protein n=1 Tax=Symbiochloris irregularis TaxID=706552 RepID=A0AAW1PJE5_9CHLO
MAAAKRWVTLESLGCPASAQVRAKAQAAGLFTGSLNDLWLFVDSETQILCESTAIQAGQLSEVSERDLQAVQEELIAALQEQQKLERAGRPGAETEHVQEAIVRVGLERGRQLALHLQAYAQELRLLGNRLKANSADSQPVPALSHQPLAATKDSGSRKAAGPSANPGHLEEQDAISTTAFLKIGKDSLSQQLRQAQQEHSELCLSNIRTFRHLWPAGKAPHNRQPAAARDAAATEACSSSLSHSIEAHEAASCQLPAARQRVDFKRQLLEDLQRQSQVLGAEIEGLRSSLAAAPTMHARARRAEQAIRQTTLSPAASKLRHASPQLLQHLRAEWQQVLSMAPLPGHLISSDAGLEQRPISQVLLAAQFQRRTAASDGDLTAEPGAATLSNMLQLADAGAALLRRAERCRERQERLARVLDASQALQAASQGPAVTALQQQCKQLADAGAACQQSHHALCTSAEAESAGAKARARQALDDWWQRPALDAVPWVTCEIPGIAKVNARELEQHLKNGDGSRQQPAAAF